LFRKSPWSDQAVLSRVARAGAKKSKKKEEEGGRGSIVAIGQH